VLLLAALMVCQPPPLTFSLRPPPPPAETPAPPAELHAACLRDALGLRASGYDTTGVRYLSLHGVAPGERESFWRTLLYALRKTKWRQTDYSPVRFYSGLLVRLDLPSLGWDKAQRSSRIALLKREGVDTSTFKEDFWEELASRDVYWFTTTYRAGYAANRGWLDPGVDYQLRVLTQASKAVLSAHQVLPLLLNDDTRTSKEHPFGKGGVYSQALLIPPKERDLYKALGVPIGLADGDSQLKSGAAVPVSYVAKANREVQFLPSAYPWGNGFLARTFDFVENTDGDKDKNVFESVVGTARHDGREVYFTKPDGDLGSALYDAAGDQVAFVPTTIAVDQRPDVADRERVVTNAYKCISCHDVRDGVIPADDRFGALALDPRVAVKAYSKDHRKLTRLLSDAEDYYLSGLPERIVSLQRTFAARAKACNGLPPAQSARLVVKFVEAYNLDLVTPEQAAREAGYDPDSARLLWRAARKVDDAKYLVQENPQLVALYAGQPIRRAAWERAFSDMMRADLFPWEYPGGMDYCLAFKRVPWMPPPEGETP
jgi:hypothetical protein